MQNITPEHYKKAIREKYEKEKSGDNSYYLETPSQARLRDLCWKIFVLSDNNDDLIIFSRFFKSEFDPTKEAAFNQYLDKFRSVGSFLKGKKEPANFYAVELASILVGFELRPYNKFRKYHTEEESETKQIKGGNADEVVTSNVQVPTENGTEKDGGNAKEVISPATFFLSSTKTFSFKRLKNIKQIIVGVALVFGLGFAISYYLFPKKQCMQWSNDHYEEVSCDLKILGTGNFNKIEPLDESVFNLKKIKVTQKTIFFKGGVAIVWYAKTANGIEFFNTHGRHPENGHALKPVTQYIINKYVVNN